MWLGHENLSELWSLWFGGIVYRNTLTFSTLLPCIRQTGNLFIKSTASVGWRHILSRGSSHSNHGSTQSMKMKNVYLFCCCFASHILQKINSVSIFLFVCGLFLVLEDDLSGFGEIKLNSESPSQCHYIPAAWEWPVTYLSSEMLNPPLAIWLLTRCPYNSVGSHEYLYVK